MTDLLVPEGTPERRVKFVEEYLKDFNATRAAKAAGYATKSAGVTASRMLRADTRVQSMIRDALMNRAGELGLSPEMIVKGLLREARGEAGDTNSGARTKAWELLGKHLGMFVDRKEIGKPGEFSQLTQEEIDEELLALQKRRGNIIPGEVVE